MSSGAVLHTVAVAVSGGRDSTALLHATLRAATPLGLRVVALHVHHGLQAQADEWVRHLRRQCARWSRQHPGLVLRVAHLSGAPARGDSVEAWARQGRRAALGRMAAEEGASLLLLAQHRQDQAETVLLQALRGGGAAGLAAMPRRQERDGLCWARPWLDHDGSAIEAYVVRHRLGHIEDPSNRDTRFDRNRLRQEIWPALARAFPQAATALTAVASQAQQLRALQDEVVERVLPGVVGPQGQLRLDAWRDQPQAHRTVLLQAWLRRALGRGATRALLSRLDGDLLHKDDGQWPVEGAQSLRAYRGVLLVPAVRTAPAVVAGAWPPTGEGWWRLPNGLGRVQVAVAEEGGLPWPLLPGAEWRSRQGGEQWMRVPGVPARALKKCFQAAAVPAWARQGPLLWSGDRLLWVPGLGTDARVVAPRGVAQARLHWLPDDVD
jgi:tRNA(Ile)-lysidine synthase